MHEVTEISKYAIYTPTHKQTNKHIKSNNYLYTYV